MASPTCDFLAQHPRNLSINVFNVTGSLHLGLKHRGIVLEEVPAVLKQMLEERIKSDWIGEHLVRILVNLRKVDSSSLEIFIILVFKGPAASEQTEIGWLIHQVALEACNKHGWEIPYDRLTVNQAEAEDWTVAA